MAEPLPQTMGEDDDVAKEELFSIKIAAMLLNRGIPWIRWSESQGFFKYPNGQAILPERQSATPTHAGYRRFSYQNIIDMADSLRRLGKITSAEYERVLFRVTALRN